MATEKTAIHGPVEIKPTSAEAVAFQLMGWIGSSEHETQTKDRDYWLTLYRQCWKATAGYSLERVRKAE